MLKDLLLKNRSYRGYDSSRLVTREELLELVDYTRIVPSAGNMQGFRYYLACEAETVNTVRGLVGWAGMLPQHKLPYEGKCPPAFIVVCHDSNLAGSPAAVRNDVGIVAQTILLAATEKGLGGCMFASFVPDKVKAALDLGETITPMLIIAIGKPDETIVLVEAKGSIKYYRDENDVHYVPKRKLEDIIF